MQKAYFVFQTMRYDRNTFFGLGREMTRSDSAETSGV